MANAKDTVKLMNSAGTVVDWFFTSCSCKDAPGATAVPKGSVEVSLAKVCMCLFVYVYVCTYACIYRYVCVCVCIYI